MDVHVYREQLLHQLKLDEKEHEEKLGQERAQKMAQLQVHMQCLLEVWFPLI